MRACVVCVCVCVFLANKATNPPSYSNVTGGYFPENRAVGVKV